MRILSIGTDREILNKGSDARSRMLLYSPLIDEMHIHCTSNANSEEKIADNIWVYSQTSWLRSISLLKKIIKEKDIDVIVSPDPFAKAWISMMFAWWYKKKFLLSVYGGNIFDEHWKKLSVFNRLYSWIGRTVFKHADAIQTDGLETFDILKKKYGEKVFWKPMVPANIDAFLKIRKMPSTLGLVACPCCDSLQNTSIGAYEICSVCGWEDDPVQSSDPCYQGGANAISLNEAKKKYDSRVRFGNDEVRKPKILYIGRLIEQKNIPFLIRVIKEIKDAEFIIVGNGPLQHLLDGLSVTRYQKNTREEIIQRFKEADILVLTSYFEGFARVVMEAALAGVPVVTTQVSGIQGIVEDKVSGYIFKQGDEKGFVEAVRSLVDNENKRREMGKEIKDRARSMLSVEMMIQKQKEVYSYLENKN